MKLAASVLACRLVMVGCSPSQPMASKPRQLVAGGAPLLQAKALRTQGTQSHLLTRRMPAPAASFVTANGKATTLQRFAGQVVVLNLWATWCAPCVREMPSLNALAGRAAETAVVAVSMDVQGPHVASEFFRRKGLDHLDAYHDPDGQLMRALGVYGLPASVVIDRNGRVAAMFQGEVDWNSTDMRRLLARV